MTALRSRLLPGLIVCLVLGQGSDRTARAAYLALLAEYDNTLSTFQTASEKARTAEEKQAIYQKQFPHARDYAPRFMELVRLHPRSEIAVDCLAWVVTHPVETTSRAAELRLRALILLQDNYIRDDRLGKLCSTMVFTIDRHSQEFLQYVLDKAPSTGVQGRGCAALAHNLKYRARLIRQLTDDREMLKEYQTTYGKPIIDRLRKQDADKLLADSQSLFKRVSEKYGAIKHPRHGTLAKLAEAHLESLRQPVTIDRAAPEITGVDMAGNTLKLSEYKGKVVLLDFWTHHFPACRAMYDYERALVKRLADKPFVLLGVNADPDRTVVKKLMVDQKLSWRSWWDGGDVGGPIATRWEVDQWPTLVLIDHKGIVRHIATGWPERKEVDETIDKLVAEVGKGK